VVGDGPELKKLRKMAGPNTEFTGFLSTPEVNEYVGKAKAFMFSSVEPFGIAVVEAQAAGTPVIAYAGGAAVEIIKQGQTGMFFHEQTPEAIVEAVNQFESAECNFEPEAARENATRFSDQVFRERFLKFVNKEVESFFSARVALTETSNSQQASVTPVPRGDEPSDS
jgi:glycosyltransferase involved in cell wall biosynthesis